MTRGQLSLDLLLALVVALIFFSLFNIYTNNLEQQVDESKLKQDMKTILYDVYATIGMAKTYEVQINYTSPRLLLSQNSPSINCTVNVDISDSGSITVTVTGTETVSFADINLMGVTMVDEFSCGQTITITGVNP